MKAIRTTGAARRLAWLGGLATALAIMVATPAGADLRRVVTEGPAPTTPAPAVGPAVSGDFDGDRRADLAWLDPEAGVVRVRYLDEDGSLSAPVFVMAGGAPVALRRADLDGDLGDDLVVTSATGALHALQGRSGRTFEATGPLGGGEATAAPWPETHPSCLIIPFAAPVHGARPFTIDLGGPELRSGALLEWQTDCEIGVLGFNVVRLLFRGGATERIQINLDPIPCRWCEGGGGFLYAYLLDPHRSIHNLFVEALMTDGSLRYLGPGEIK